MLLHPIVSKDSPSDKVWLDGIVKENIFINISNELNVLKEELDIATKELAAIQEEFANVHWLTLK